MNENTCTRCGKSSLKPERCPYCGTAYGAPPEGEVDERRADLLVVDLSPEIFNEDLLIVARELRVRLIEMLKTSLSSGDNLRILRVMSALIGEAAEIAVKTGVDSLTWTILTAELYTRVQSGFASGGAVVVVASSGEVTPPVAQAPARPTRPLVRRRTRT